MNTYFDYHFQKKITMILPGEMFVSGDDIFIGTVLGSCVSVLLFDPVRHIGGMNHFMLADSVKDVPGDDAGRYGVRAIPMLIEKMIQKGADPNKMSAKVFGGGNVLISPGSHIEVSDKNISCAFSVLHEHKIPVLVSETGGGHSYKLFYSPVTSKVLLRRKDSD